MRLALIPFLVLCLLAIYRDGRRRARQERGRKIAQELADALMRRGGPLWRA